MYLILREYINYYSGKTRISDQLYDMISDYYYSKNLHQEKSDKIGAPVSGTNKHKLPYRVTSLDKLHSTDKQLEKFLKSDSNDKIISEKLDGNSLLIGKNNSNIPVAYTRGNGIYGQDVSQLLPHIKTSSKTDLLKIISTLKSNTYIRGEIIISKKNWESSPELGNSARNVIAGLMHRKTYSTKELTIIESNVDFLGYEIIHNNVNVLTPLQMFETIKELGIDTPKYKVLKNKDCTANIMPDLLQQFYLESEYEIDGIVIANNLIYQLVIKGNPKHSKAFKMNEMNQKAITKVKYIEWTITKSNKLKPLIHVEEVNIDNANINKCYQYNAKFILENKLGAGSVVEMIRSGAVIPKISKIISPKFDIETDFPKVHWKWDTKKIDILSLDLSSDERTLRILEYFINSMDIEFIGKKTIKKLYDIGLDSIEKYLSLKTTEILLKADGIKTKTADKILESVKQKLSDASYLTFASSLGCFSGLAKEKLKLVLELYPDFHLIDKKILSMNVPKLNGFSSVSTKKLIDGIDKFKYYLDLYYQNGYSFESKSIQIDSGSKEYKPLSGKFLTFSGIRCKSTRNQIEEYGGIINESLKKNTSILIVPEWPIKKISAKMKKAMQDNIEIISLQDFKLFLKKLESDD